MCYFRGTSRQVPEEWAAIELARYLNRYLGTQLAPWDLGQVPDIWIEMIVEGAEIRAELGEAGLIRE